MTLSALTIVGSGYIISILPQPIIWAVSISKAGLLFSGVRQQRIQGGYL